MTHKVKVVTFKPSGTYYTSGEYVTELVNMFEIFDEVKWNALHGMIPGVNPNGAWSSEPGTADWILHVTSEVPNGYPGLIVLRRDSQGNRVAHPFK